MGKKLICKLPHCRCMNLGGNCSSHHYKDDCFEEDKKISIELSLQEHTMITAILMMHTTGLIVEIHPDKRPMLHEIADKFANVNIKERYGLA